MAYMVVKMDKTDVGKAKRILNDDLLSRQSATIRDGGAIGQDDSSSFVILEGAEEAIEKAVEMFRSEGVGSILDGEEKEKIYNLIKEEEESSMAGMGAIFG